MEENDLLMFNLKIFYFFAGETITFQYNETSPNIVSDQFGIRDFRYDARQDITNYEMNISWIKKNSL